ncbi:MAG: hypothetical protein QXO51_08335 [Halobacteria archaeon]
MNAFALWHAAAATNLPGFYNTVFSDYPPFNILIFSIIGRAEGAAGLLGTISAPFSPAETLFLKLPQNLADLGIVILIYVWLRPKSHRVALLGAAAYAFNPATIFDLAVWGQWDSLYTIFMVGGIMAVLRRRFELSGALLALAVLTKPQGVLVLPVIAYLVLQEGGLKRTISSAIVAGGVVLAVIAPFQGASNPIAFIAERYFGAYDLFRQTSLNAYTFWAMAGMRVSDQTTVLGLSYQSWGWLSFLSIAGFLMWQLDKRYPAACAKMEDRDRLFLQVAFLTLFAFFMLSTRIHERYLFPALALLVLAWPRDRLLYVALSGSYLFNLAHVLQNLNREIYVVRDWTVPVFVAFNGVLFFWALFDFWKGKEAHLHMPPASG